MASFKKSNRKKKLPVVLTIDEISCLIAKLSGVKKLMVSLLYGSGLRRMELLRLRVKDVQFDLSQLHVWDYKGAKSRIVTLAKELHVPLKAEIKRVDRLLKNDLSNPQYA
ncbi:MAG: tyrosine-type recombinase/integrase [Pseudomonadota bacterium]|nr:tyrosine-type recombinase/integrase [Methylophaga aminisulfidivorans]MEC9412188.1 tyrosine-type recombinase/integrase [Pseudomonadota bacterium]